MSDMFSSSGSNESSPLALSGVSVELRALIDKIKEKRGTGEDWLKMEYAVMQRIGACSPDEHVWCRGEIHGVKRHYPAVVIMNRDSRVLKVLAPSGEDGAMEEHPHHFFSSSVPHIGIVREVLNKNDSADTI